MTSKSALVGAVLAASTPQIAMTETYGKYETPPYAVQAQLGQVELRNYAPYIVAEVTVQGDQRQALNTGFQVLANYIFGGNQARDSIAMTAPVGQSQSIAMTSPVGQSGGDGTWDVTFTMPREWTLDTLPIPNSDAVRFRTEPAHRQVVYTFSGRATAAALRRAEGILRDAVGVHDLEVEGALQAYYYDDPFTLPWKRRNEVALRLKEAE